MLSIPVSPPITEYLHMKAARFLIPLSGTFELTPVCNMNCRMCYVRMDKKKQESIRPLHSAQDWIKLGQECKDRGMLYLLLTGGEPFLHPEFKEIMQSLHKMGLMISINSNGTMIDESVIEWLKETPPVRINITLYGASDETYERLCRNPKGFTQATRAIKLLKENHINVKINCSVTPHNAQDLEEIIAFCRKENLVIQPTSYMFPPMRKDKNKIGTNDRFTPFEAAYYAAKIELYLNGRESFIEKYKNNDFSNIGAESECTYEEGEKIRCRAGTTSFWVTWDGKLFPCGMIIDENAKDVFLDGFDDAWRYAIDYSRGIRLPKECRACNLKNICRACAAMVLTETGSYDKVPEYKCQMTKSYPMAFKKVYDEIKEQNNEE